MTFTNLPKSLVDAAKGIMQEDRAKEKVKADLLEKYGVTSEKELSDQRQKAFKKELSEGLLHTAGSAIKGGVAGGVAGAVLGGIAGGVTGGPIGAATGAGYGAARGIAGGAVVGAARGATDKKNEEPDEVEEGIGHEIGQGAKKGAKIGAVYGAGLGQGVSQASGVRGANKLGVTVGAAGGGAAVGAVYGAGVGLAKGVYKHYHKNEEPVTEEEKKAESFKKHLKKKKIVDEGIISKEIGRVARKGAGLAAAYGTGVLVGTGHPEFFSPEAQAILHHGAQSDVAAVALGALGTTALVGAIAGGAIGLAKGIHKAVKKHNDMEEELDEVYVKSMYGYKTTAEKEAEYVAQDVRAIRAGRIRVRSGIKGAAVGAALAGAAALGVHAYKKFKQHQKKKVNEEPNESLATFAVKKAAPVAARTGKYLVRRAGEAALDTALVAGAAAVGHYAGRKYQEKQQQKNKPPLK